MEVLSIAPETNSNSLIRRFLSLLTPFVCRTIFACLLLLGVASHWSYLNHDCPLNLSGDEAQYWDWSRQLDISYYSKGPLVAYIIRASCAVLGDTMPAVRLPAVILGVGTSLCTYWLIIKLFKSDRLALGMVAMMHFVPVFIAGSILMTIDPPFFFCWALVTCLAVKAIFDDSKWAWPAMGVVLGIGFLAKYAMFLWPIGFILFLWIDRGSRRYLKSTGFWTMIAIALAFTTPVILWNARHDWASFYHVQHQTSTGFKLTNPLEFLGGQAAILGLSLVFFVIGAIAYVFRDEGKKDPNYRALVFLIAIGLTFWCIVGLDSFRSKVQPNWPAPAYFTLLILPPYFLARRLGADAKHKWWWRGNLFFFVLFGLIFAPLAHDFSHAYRFLPMINKVASTFGAKKPKLIRNIDFTYKMRGSDELGKNVGEELKRLSPGAFVLADDYQQTATLAFYVPGQPKTYYCGSYFKIDPARYCQYDMCPDRSLEPGKTNLIGKDAIYVGGRRDELNAAFASVELLPPLKIYVRGYEVRDFRIWRCLGFKGLPRSNNERR